jgi:hypothetical protein
MENPKQLQMELVEWIDSFSIGGWRSCEEYVETTKHTMTCWTAGFVFDETKERLSLALSANQDSFHSSITIPKRAIVSRSTLSRGRKR